MIHFSASLIIAEDKMIKLRLKILFSYKIMDLF